MPHHDNHLRDDASLLAAVLGGHSRRVREGGLSLVEAVQRPEDLDLTPTQARRLHLVLELHRRLIDARKPVKPRLTDPEAVAELMAPRLSLLEHETFWALPLDCRNRLIGEPIQVSMGDVDGTDAGPRAFFRQALRRGAVSVIAVHNHPTGDPSPSPQDRGVTVRLAKAGRAVDVEVVDHLIIGTGWISLRRDEPELFMAR